MLHLFIINPTAGVSDDSKTLVTKIKSVFKDKDYAIELTQYHHHATELVKAYSERYDKLCVYACGGDGTVNEVLNGIQNKNTILAIIPIGSGNDFVRNVPSSKNLEDFLTGEVMCVDTLKIGHLKGLNVISAGFDSAVAKNMYRFRKFGKRCYHMSILYCILNSMKNRFGFIIDDKIKIEKGNFLMGICANGQYYGGGMHVSPHSNIQDGFLNFISVKSISRLQIASFMKIFEQGRHIDELKQYIDTLHCKKVQFISDQMIDVSIDGEIVQMYNPTIEIIPQSLQLLVPKKENVIASEN